jgi:hypothetical protein
MGDDLMSATGARRTVARARGEGRRVGARLAGLLAA